MFSLKKFLMATLLIFAVSFSGIAEAGIITDRLPFYCYVDHKVNTYRDPNGQIVGYISANEDLVRVTQVRSDGWAYGDYPISNGKRIARWFRVSELCADPGYSNRGTNVRGAQTVFRLPNNNIQFGSVSNNESVIVLADNGNRAQILYRLNNGQGYKVGWVSSSSVRNGGGNITNIKGDANNDGKVTQEDVNLIQRYIVGNVGDSAINKNNADYNGDGQINIFDMSAILSKIKNNSNVTPGARNPFSNGWYKIHPIHDLGRYVDAAGGNYNVHMWDNAEVPQQKFYLQDRGNGYFSLKSGHGDFYITAAGNGNGANLYVRSWAGSDSQLFKVVDAGNNSYHIVPKFNEHLNWDCAGAGRANGNNVQLWSTENNDWHKWRFESTSAPQNPTPSPSGNKYIWPIKNAQKPDNYIINTLYYYQGDPLNNGNHKHSSWYSQFYALDIKCTYGKEIVAVADGEVIASGSSAISRRGAKFVKIQHQSGTISLYAHLSNNDIVKIGDKVSQGQKIGISGDTGTPGSPHLHFEFSNLNAFKYYRDKYVLHYCSSTKNAYNKVKNSISDSDRNEFEEAINWISTHGGFEY